MLLQFAFPFLLVSSTNKVEDTRFSCSGNFASETGSAPAHFVCPASYCFHLQNFYWPWNSALEILGAPECALAGVILKPVWRSDLLDSMASGQAAVSSLEDPQDHLGCDAHPAKSRQKHFEEIISCGGRVIKNEPTIQQVASLSTPEVVRDGLSSPTVNSKSEPGIVSWVDQSDAHVRAEQSFEITSAEARAVHFADFCEPDLMASRPVWMDDVHNLPASEWVLAPISHDQQGAPQLGAESIKSAQARPVAINLGEASMIKSASENLHSDCSSTKKSPYGLPYSFNFADRSLGQSQWLGTVSTTDNFAGPTVLGGSHSKNYSSKRIPKATESTRQVVRSWVYQPPKNTDREPGIGSWVDQSDARICVEQSFDFTLIEALPAQFGVIDGLHAMASETNSQRHFSECRADFESTTPLLSRLTRSDTPSLSPAKSRSTGSDSAISATQNADGYPINPPLGRSDSPTNHLPLCHPDEVPRAKFLANATTISAQSRAKAGCPTHLRQTQTPHKTIP